MLGESDRSVHDILRDRGGDDRSERDEAADWLTRYLIDRGGEAIASDAIKAARDGFAKTTLTRARQQAHVTSSKGAFNGPWGVATRPTKNPRRTRRIQEMKGGIFGPLVDSSATKGQRRERH
jgi:hypothetical protein